MPFATPDRRNGGDNGHLTVAWGGGQAEMRPRQRGPRQWLVSRETPQIPRHKDFCGRRILFAVPHPRHGCTRPAACGETTRHPRRLIRAVPPAGRRHPSRAKHLDRSAARLPPLSPLSPLRRLPRSPINSNLVRPDLHRAKSTLNSCPAQSGQAQPCPVGVGVGVGIWVGVGEGGGDCPENRKMGSALKVWSGALKLAAEPRQTVGIESHMWLMFASVASGQTTHRLT
jgi:hypothetical protein